jgi:hypothetical protein
VKEKGTSCLEISLILLLIVRKTQKINKYLLLFDKVKLKKKKIKSLVIQLL